MLQAIRDRAQGLIIWTIVGLIIITFALFGLSGYLGGGGKSIVATVNGVEITENELLREYQNTQQRLQQMLGQNYRADLFDEQALKARVLEGLIQRELINQALEDAGFDVAPEQVRATIQNIPAFQDESGKFSVERYKQVLAVQGMNSAVFERQIARDIADQHLRNGIERSAFVTEAELTRYQQLQNQLRNIGYFRLPLSAYLDKVQISDDEIRQYYESNPDAFRTPEQVAVDYVELDLADMAKQVKVDAEQIKAFYEQHRDNYLLQPEERKVRHILLTVKAQQDDAAARDKAMQILARLQSGEDFASLARTVSEDPGSAQQGGDLGYIRRGMMDKPFEEAAFRLKQGQLSQPVRSRFGYHIIQVTDIKPARYKPLAEVREQIRKELQLQQAEQRFYEEVDRLNNLSYEVPDSLQPVADELGLPVKHSPLFSRDGGPGIFANPKLISAAFSDDVLNANRNSDLVELSDTHVVVLHLREHKPPARRPLAEVRSRIIAQLKQEKAMALARQDADAAIARLEAGEAPAAVAANWQRKWQTAEITRQGGADDKLDGRIREAAFELPRPMAGKAAYTRLVLPEGDVVVLALLGVKDGAPATDSEALKGLRDKLGTAMGQAEYTAFIDYLKSQADITRNLQPSEEP